MAAQAVGLRELQPVGVVASGFLGAFGEQQTGRTAQPARDEPDDLAAAHVEPLDVVDRQDHRPRPAQEVDGVEDGGRSHPVVGLRSVGVPAQEEPVEGEALHLGQFRGDVGVDVVEQVGDRRIRQRGLGLPGARRQHPETPGAGVLHRAEPQPGLADAGLTFEEEAGRAVRHGSEEIRDGRRSGRRFPERVHHAMIANSKWIAKPTLGMKDGAAGAQGCFGTSLVACATWMCANCTPRRLAVRRGANIGVVSLRSGAPGTGRR